MKSLLWSLALGTLLLPLSLSAAAEQTLDLRAGQINAEWEGLGDISMQRAVNGIVLSTGASTGMLVTDTPFSITPDSALLVADADKPTRVLFVWSTTGFPATNTSFIETMIGGEIGTKSMLLLDQFPTWTDEDKSIGILLPPFSQIELQRIELYEWSVSDNMRSLLSSLMTFDEMRPYSINFVWGPYLAFDPFSVHTLYNVLPPVALSLTWLLNSIVILLLVVLLLKSLMRRYNTQHRDVPRWAAISIVVVWIGLDTYMGAQFLSWVQHDYQTYGSGVAQFREFRDRDRFYDFAAFARDLVQDRERYIFVAETPWPYLGNIRYLTYPSIPAFNIEHDDTWVIYRRPDFNINVAGQLMLGAEPLTFPGAVLGAFDEHSFVFRGAPLPLPPQ